MIEILVTAGSIVFGLNSVILLIIYIKAFNNFLRVFRETDQHKWSELGSLQSIRLEFHNKRARADVDRWLKKETDEKYNDLKNIYSPVSRLEIYFGISAVITVVFLLLHFLIIGKLSI
jgi:hypothetical protein